MDQTFVNDNWLKHPAFKEWIKKDTGNKRAYYKYCKKSFVLSNMGIQAVKSQTNGKNIWSSVNQLVYFSRNQL